MKRYLQSSHQKTPNVSNCSNQEETRNDNTLAHTINDQQLGTFGLKTDCQD